MLIRLHTEIRAISTALTDLPVPEVFLHQSNPGNPVKAEWILVQHMPGTMLSNCYDDFTKGQAFLAAGGVARIMSTLFSITANRCGSIIPQQGDLNISHSSIKSGSGSPIQSISSQSDNVPNLNLAIGPVNDSTLLFYPNQLPPDICGPFKTEKEWMEGFTYLGIPGTRVAGDLGVGLMPLEKI